MIPSGLKVGQTYEYYGLTYRVTRVVGENYESERVGVTPPLTLVEPKPEKVETPKKSEQKVEKPDYESMQYAQLKKLCAERGLDAKGTKADLIARLGG